MTGATLSAATSAEELARLAYAQPALHPQILRHPAIYPELADWIMQAAAPTAAPAAPVTTGGGVSGRPSGRLQWVLIGAGIGAVGGIAISLLLVLVVLPGLFGGGIG